MRVLGHGMGWVVRVLGGGGRGGRGLLDHILCTTNRIANLVTSNMLRAIWRSAFPTPKHHTTHTHTTPNALHTPVCIDKAPLVA